MQRAVLGNRARMRGGGLESAARTLARKVAALSGAARIRAAAAQTVFIPISRTRHVDTEYDNVCPTSWLNRRRAVALARCRKTSHRSLAWLIQLGLGCCGGSPPSGCPRPRIHTEPTPMTTDGASAMGRGRSELDSFDCRIQLKPGAARRRVDPPHLSLSRSPA